MVLQGKEQGLVPVGSIGLIVVMVDPGTVNSCQFLVDRGDREIRLN